jgi:photosystem II stability/assembly factor-like uncharacterized protein
MKKDNSGDRQSKLLYWLALLAVVLMAVLYFGFIYRPNHQSAGVSRTNPSPTISPTKKPKASFTSVNLKFDNFWPIVISNNANYIFGVVENFDNNSNLLSCDIYLSRDRGLDWQKVYTVPDLVENMVLSEDESHLVVVTLNDLYISQNSGTNWKTVAAPGMVTRHGQAFSGTMGISMDGNKMVVQDSLVNSGLIYSVDGGKTWSVTAGKPVSNNDLTISNVALSDSGNILVCTVDNEGIYISNDLGKTWKQALPLNEGWYSLNMSGDGSLIAAGTFMGSGLYISTDSGLTWRLAFSGPQLTTNSYNDDMNIPYITIARENKTKMTITEQTHKEYNSPTYIPMWIYSSNDLGQSWVNNPWSDPTTPISEITYSSDGKILAFVSSINKITYLYFYQ